MIGFDRCVTVFSFNGKGYDRYVFYGSSIFGSDGIEMPDGSFKRSGQYKIRIPSEEKLDIKVGDRVLLEEAEVLDFENALTIMKITDNRRGNFMHYLLTVK